MKKMNHGLCIGILVKYLIVMANKILLEKISKISYMNREQWPETLEENKGSERGE